MQDVVIVTGASSGIGSEVAEELANRGYTLIAIAPREKLLRRLYSFNTNIIPLVADLSSDQGRQALQECLDNEEASVSCLIHSNTHRNTTGINKPSPLSTLNLTQQLSPYFKKTKVVLVSSDINTLQRELEETLFDSLKETVDSQHQTIEIVRSQSIEQVLAEVPSA
ncbi:hypothetical protein GZ77_11155 [Endozoicomonas montiporae]|uniref:Short-chain dehydrogenase n=2 Tax=Endozoicomonas montiporae TaxID=1027273 RepID=A0A081N8Q3_9GAMM|nr:SDR family oxidoreductase [Endozoicomonas montiporae]AMO55269.1 short-chain dehydrogenase/reductase SDR [Endozoicomonas montiporae CL-33]KEQ14826.1 hypothetical protein GZ77_11155 [Endozoicomonas montiporae]